MVALQNWINQAREHWKEFRPSVYRGLTTAGILEASLRCAAEQTDLEMSQLTDRGYNEQEAWEMTREKYLFPPEEGSTLSQNDGRLYNPAGSLTDDLHAAIKSATRTIAVVPPTIRPAELKNALREELSVTTLPEEELDG
jgi:hypothetical protein